jgi:zinc transporter ZupT
LIAMSAEPGRNPEPPPLPPVLLGIRPFFLTGGLAWLVAVAAAFLVPALESWRPIALAGLATGVVGLGVFSLQLAAARRGSRGAQTGLESFLNPK